MSSPVFKPDHHDRIACQRGWAVLRVLVEKLALLVAAMSAADSPNAARHLCRVGEALARRLLTVRALSLPLPKVAPFTRAVREAFARAARRRKLDPRDVRYVAPQPTIPRLKLAEPLASFSSIDPPKHTPRDWRLPAYREEQHGVLTVRIHRVGGIEAPEPTDQGAPLERRLAALQAVVESPSRATRRMARWLARQRSLRHGRRSPMRPGRAPGQVRERERSWEQSALADADHVAHRAHAAVPRTPVI